MEPDQQRPAATPVVEHFDSLSRSGEWSRLYEQLDAVSYHAHIRRRRVLELMPAQLGHVIDVGCGPGVMVDAVLARGGTFQGIDLSREMVAEAREGFGDRDGVTFDEGDIEALDVPDGDCDQVICMGVVEYLTAPDRALAEMARILRPGGTAIVTVPKRRHIDLLTIRALAPLRAVARRAGVPGSDRLPRLRMQPGELDRAAAAAGLVPDGGAQYHYTPLPYPSNRLAPALTMRLNLPFERWHAERDRVRSFFAHGYVGRYRKS
jgi:SAM-dependent methyltransferase